MPEILSIESRINAFAHLGQIMGRAAKNIMAEDQDFQTTYPELYSAIQSASQSNRWYTLPNISFAFQSWSDILTRDLLHAWVSSYNFKNNKSNLVAVIMAGNIPIVGFHDFLSILLSGNKFLGKLSSDDKILLPALADILCKIEPGFTHYIQFKENRLEDFNAIIATGSNNSARYFEYYFSNYPHIIRKNRNGVAILSGNETNEELIKLGVDICSYFGLGCRNVSKIFIPSSTDPAIIFKSVEPYFEQLSSHNKYMNNYTYQRSVLLLNNAPHYDNGVILLKESPQYSSPVATLHYEFYDSPETLRNKLDTDKGLIQCVVNDPYNTELTIKFGKSQTPGLSDYADGIDTMKFLNDL